MTARPLVAVLDYGIGNLRSAQKALERVGADARLTADHDLIASADGVVLPGVGAFGRCVQALDTAELSDTAGDAAREGKGPSNNIPRGPPLGCARENPPVRGGRINNNNTYYKAAARPPPGVRAREPSLRSGAGWRAPPTLLGGGIPPPVPHAPNNYGAGSPEILQGQETHLRKIFSARFARRFIVKT